MSNSSRFNSLKNEFWLLHAERGDYNGVDSVMHALNSRGPSVELASDAKLELVGFSNLSAVGISSSNYAGSLPLTRLGITPSVALNASPKWITGGAHLAKHNPSFKEFCKQQSSSSTRDDHDKHT